MVDVSTEDSSYVWQGGKNPPLGQPGFLFIFFTTKGDWGNKSYVS